MMSLLNVCPRSSTTSILDERTTLISPELELEFCAERSAGPPLNKSEELIKGLPFHNRTEMMDKQS